MNPAQAENLRILIRHMERDVTRNLDMGRIQFCGAPACAWGEACMVPALQPYLGTLDRRTGFDGLADCFGIASITKGLFSGALKTKRIVSPVEWAAEARKVLTESGYTMDDGFAAFKAKVLVPVALEIA